MKKMFGKPEKLLGKPESLLKTPKKKSPVSGNVFESVARTVEEKNARPPRESLKHWDESQSEYNLRTYRKNREALLHECVPEKKCPICGRLRLRSAQWVVITRKHMDRFQGMPEHFEILEAHLNRVICRSCVTAWNYERRRLEGRPMGRRKETEC